MADLSRLEHLPNEVFVEIFKCFNAQDLFRSFNNLNSRFNTIIRSLNHLIFTFFNYDYIENNHFCPYITILVTHCETGNTLNDFSNIRHLIIMSLTDDLLKHLNSDVLPFLEHLVIKYLSCNMFDLYNKIFRSFPHLKSCYMLQADNINMIQQHIQAPLLQILHTGGISLFVYQLILTTCHNLNFFKFSPSSSEQILVVEPHHKLKHIIIYITDCFQPPNDSVINTCLSLAPNLEQLTIHKSTRAMSFTQLENYDWYSSAITNHLPFLRTFRCFLHGNYYGYSDTRMKIFIEKMKIHFQMIHNNRYTSKLILDLDVMSYTRINDCGRVLCKYRRSKREE